MTNVELAAYLASESGTTKQQAGRMLSALQGAMLQSVAHGGTLKIIGLGTFKATKRAARLGVNPKTGDTLHIPQKAFVTFNPTKTLRERIHEYLITI